MATAQIIAERHAGFTLGEVGRTVTRSDHVAKDGNERSRRRFRPHQRDLRPRPVEHLRSHRVSLDLVAVEKSRRGVATDDGGEFPAKVHRIAQPEVEPLTAKW